MNAEPLSFLTLAAWAAVGGQEAEPPSLPCELHHLPIIVRFDSGSAQLSEVGRAILDNFIWPYLHYRIDWRVNVSGHTDSTGSAATNLRLSRRRAEAARDYLVEQGIPRARIALRAAGERDLLAITKDNAPEPINRYVLVHEVVPPQELARRRRECPSRSR